MSNKKYIISTVYITLMIVAVVGTWLIRGFYDEIRLYRGYFHLVNGTENQKTIELTFPSGESRNANLHPGKSKTFIVTNTGEGSIIVKSDGQQTKKVGYVTSFNHPIVIVVTDEQVVFSLLSIP